MKNTSASFRTTIFRVLYVAAAVNYSHGDSLNAAGANLDESIRRIRTGKLVIEAAPGADVRVEQLRHEFWFGAALANQFFTGRPDSETAARYKQVFLENFNAAVTENALKWHSMEPRQGMVDYGVVDRMLAWTEQHEIPLRGHNVFWGIPNRVQPWLKTMDDDTLRQTLKARAADIARRYRGQFAEYDLNNEMLHANYYEQRLGANITRDMAAWMRQEDPQAVLYLNDYDILTGRRLEDYIVHSRKFLDQGVPIGGIGVQGHLHGDTFDAAALKNALDRLAPFKLPIRVTEFNFPGQRSKHYGQRGARLSDEEEQAKAKALGDYYRICFAHPAVQGILMWGFWEGANWIPVSSLFRRDWSATPAAGVYRDLVFKQWWTDWRGQADAQGRCEVPAFFGKHRVTVGGQEKVVHLKRAEPTMRISFRESSAGPRSALHGPMGPLRVCTANPRYFADPSGRPVYLTGSHTWQSLQDGILSNYTAVTQPFDHAGYLNLLQTNHHNFVRLWRWELTTHEPQPWLRTGPGLARDGKPKFDLRQFNQAYFDRLRSRVIAARDRGIYVSIMLFEDWVFMNKRKDHPVEQHPFHRDNNVSGINGDPNGDGWGIEIHTLQVPEVVKVQKAYVRKVIASVNDLDNVLYEICNEGLRHTREWQYDMVRFVKSVEATMPEQHPVGMTSVGDMNESCLNSPADWTSLGTTGWDQSKDPWTSNPPAADGRKVCLLDTDHIGWKVFINDAAFTRGWVWKSFARGHNPLLMENLADSAGWIAGRAAMGHTRRYAERMDLAKATPQPASTATGFCLAVPGREYLIYLPQGGRLTMDLSAIQGKMATEWFDPKTGVMQPGQPVTGSSSCEFDAPFGGDAVLYLRATD